MSTQPLFIVTGAAGWLGQCLVAFLRTDPRASGSRVRALILPQQAAISSWQHVDVVHGDVTNPSDCDHLLANAKDAVLFHTVGIIHPRRVGDFVRVNVEGTRTLLQAAQKAGVRRVVLMSSNSPCGCNPHVDHMFDEESPYHPYRGYGRSKMRMEQDSLAFYRAGDVEVVIIRAPWFYGPYQPARQTQFFTLIRRGLAPVVGDGNNLRSMAYMDNLCEGLFLAAVKPVAGEIFWIADRQPYTMIEIFGTIERLLSDEFHLTTSTRRIHLPSIVGSLASVADASLQALSLYSEKIHVLSEMNKTIVCSIEKAERVLGYNPTVALEEGMRRSIRWCLDAGLTL